MRLFVVVPNWNGAERISTCLDSLLAQTQNCQVVVVDNGSSDSSVEIVENKYSQVILLKNKSNLGFAGGVNTGIKYALTEDADFIALFNNDAVAEKDWLKHLLGTLQKMPKAGIVTSKICDSKKTHLDSTGDFYTTWGLPYPRGRGEKLTDKYDSGVEVFGASGGASLYRAKTLEQIGLFDEDFFAYYEDVDISFRAQLSGWKVVYEPKAIVYHEISATGGGIKGFATYHTIKNLPWLAWKNVPAGLLLKVLPRFYFAYCSFVFSALMRGQFGPVLKGVGLSLALWPKKMAQRYSIQKNREASTGYIDSIIIKDLPPNAHKLRSLRSKWWNTIGKNQ